jgi:hypothetical protein
MTFHFVTFVGKMAFSAATGMRIGGRAMPWGERSISSADVRARLEDLARETANIEQPPARKGVLRLTIPRLVIILLPLALGGWIVLGK